MASNNGASSSSNDKTSNCKGFFIGQVLLRVLAAIFALAALLVMIKSGQSTTVFGIEFQAKYSYSSAFRFLVGVDIVICVFSVISLIIMCAVYGPSSNSKGYFFVFLHDLVTLILMISGCAAATAVGYIGRYGQDQTGWTKICDNVKKFCNFVLVSIVLSYLAFFCLFVLTIMAFKRAHQPSC